MIYIVLSLIVIFFIYLYFKDKTVTKVKPSASLSIENIDIGGVFNIKSFSKDFEDVDFKVIGKNLYQEGDFYWHELECDGGDLKIWMELEKDDDLDITVVDKKINFEDLNITSDYLKNISINKSYLKFEGEKFIYKSNGNAIFYKNFDKQNPQKFMYWDFESEDLSISISIERWNETNYDISLSKTVIESNITVYSLT